MVASTEKDLSCGFCKVQVPEEPVEGRCGHLYCWQCVVERGASTCGHCTRPVSPETVLELSRDTRSLLVRVTRRVPCEHCSASVLLKDTAAHALECTEFPTHCGLGCGFSLPRRAVRQHEAEECTLRKIACPQECGSAPIPVMKITEHLTNSCPKTLLPCPNGCQEQFYRTDLAAHISECPRLVLECAYAAGGCKARFERRNLDAHNAESKDVHLSAAGLMLKSQFSELDQLKARVSHLEQEKANQPEFMNFISGVVSGKCGAGQEAVSPRCRGRPLKKVVNAAKRMTAGFSLLNWICLVVGGILFSSFPLIVLVAVGCGFFRRWKRDQADFPQQSLRMSDSNNNWQSEFADQCQKRDRYNRVILCAIMLAIVL